MPTAENATLPVSFFRGSDELARRRFSGAGLFYSRPGKGKGKSAVEMKKAVSESTRILLSASSAVVRREINPDANWSGDDNAI